MAERSRPATPARSRSAPALRDALAWASGGALAGAFYLLLIDTLALPELAVLAVAAVLSATGLEFARERLAGGKGIELRWLARLHRPLVRVPGDVVHVVRQILVALVRRERSLGAFRAVPFAPAEGRRASAHALAEALGSLAPNTIVVGVDRERGLLLAHQLRRSGGRKAVDLLELG